MNKAEKQAEIDFLASCFEKSQLALCADYQGITVAEATKLRAELRKCGSVTKVVKNKLAIKAIEKINKETKNVRQEEFSKFIDLLNGPCFIVMNEEDPVTPVKTISNFIKQSKKMVIKGALMEGAFLDTSKVAALSEMPSKEQIIARLLSLLNAPATYMLRLLKTPGEQLARVIDAHRKNMEGKVNPAI